MPPLLKTLSARSIYTVKKMVLLSKSEQIFGLGAGLIVHRWWKGAEASPWSADIMPKLSWG